MFLSFACSNVQKIDQKRHRVIKVAHPSPLSVKQWTGCRTFSKINDALTGLGKTPINWHLSAKVNPAAVLAQVAAESGGSDVGCGSQAPPPSSAASVATTKKKAAKATKMEVEEENVEGETPVAVPSSYPAEWDSWTLAQVRSALETAGLSTAALDAAVSALQNKKDEEGPAVGTKRRLSAGSSESPSKKAKLS
jgi:hypothetical protein